ncbi:MAG: TDP-N-acetylfucosamine:lipid II N-acetylfucosaminyltransferase [Chitinophagaceae bacterium]|nr:TDP-N-acetylfucosamine:lipid II N-acetylfucosaminyltransferase [Chitinophagaceae bacterium]MBL0055595.1 TDP-N-acetylfucosamine:lipid II N-acetylfucosaminyltransferase [Chitinophagaceae bacterium]
MNLHVTSDTYGLYTLEIADRIRHSGYGTGNIIVNLGTNAELKDNSVVYISGTKTSFTEYMNTLEQVSKVVFHPYNFTGYEFLKELLKKFPGVKVYWICWSYEFYNLPHVVNKLYEPFALKYIRSKTSVSARVKQSIVSGMINIRGWARIKKNYRQQLKDANQLVHYFCSPFPTDFYFLNKIIPANRIAYEPFAYLSINKIMPALNEFSSTGNKIMIGHSASPDGNHYEVIEKIGALSKDYPVLLPLVYGDSVYAGLIIEKARSVFNNIEVLKNKLDKSAYYQKLSEAGWAVINVKVQQGVGNIIGLVWMGTKIFLDKHSSIYIDFVEWGVFIFNIQDHLNRHELETRLTTEQVNTNKKIILEKFGEDRVQEYWNKILS